MSVNYIARGEDELGRRQLGEAKLLAMSHGGGSHLRSSSVHQIKIICHKRADADAHANAAHRKTFSLFAVCSVQWTSE